MAKKIEYLKEKGKEIFDVDATCSYAQKKDCLLAVKSWIEDVCALKSDEVKQDILEELYNVIEAESDNYFESETCWKYLSAKKNEAQIICSIKNPDIQLALFRKYLTTDHVSYGMEYLSGDALEIICGIRSDEIKLMLIKELEDEKYIEAIVDSLDSQKLKEQFAKDNPWYISQQDRELDYYDPYEGEPHEEEQFEDDYYEDGYYEEDDYEEEQSEIDLDTLSFEELSEMETELDIQIVENEKTIKEQQEQERTALLARIYGKRATIKEQQTQLQKLQHEKSTQISKDSYQH